MRILLISANTETINMPTLPMGLACVAAAVSRAGHKVTFLDLMGREDAPSAAVDAIAGSCPDVIGISIRNIDDQNSHSPKFLLDGARDVVAACKAATAAPVVLGGAGYSMFPAAALSYIGADMGIQGEGEVSFNQLLDRLGADRSPDDVPGLYVSGLQPSVKPNFTTDLDRLPLPSPGLFDPKLANDPACYLPFQTRRGCPLGCSYCATSTIEGRHIRRRSPAAVVASLKDWRKAGFQKVFFVDNTFNLPPGYARELCERLSAEKLGLQWRAILYPGHIDANLVSQMKRAGCTEVSLGFESGTEPLLKAMGKGFGPDDIQRASRLLAEVGIQRMGFLMLGGPGETKATVEESLHFADELQLEAMRLTVGVRIYPNTPLEQLSRREGMINASDDLLIPRFYIVTGMESWLRETIAQWVNERPSWFM